MRAQGLIKTGDDPAETVALSLDDRGVLIEERGETGGPLVWPFGAITTEPPLKRATASGAVLRYAYMPETTLAVADGAYLAELMRLAPALAHGGGQRHAFGPGTLILGTLALIALLIWAVANLGFARMIADQIPDSARARIADQMRAQFTREHGRCTAPAGRRALNRLATRLAAAAPAGAIGPGPTTGNADRAIDVTVLDWGIVNAFAAPGGAVFLTRGLIAGADGPSEVAGVFAHEIGHAVARHPETAVVRAVGLSAGLALVFGDAASLATDVGGQLLRLSYAREDERTADRIALEILSKAGISPGGLADFFARLVAQDDAARNGPVLDVLSTHPAPAERLDAIRAAEARARAAGPAMSPDAWRALTSICSQTTRSPLSEAGSAG